MFVFYCKPFYICNIIKKVTYLWGKVKTEKAASLERLFLCLGVFERLFVNLHSYVVFS